MNLNQNLFPECCDLSQIRIILMCLFSMIISPQANGQGQNQIIGRILSHEHVPLTGASVSLFRENDSIPVSGTLSDNNGRFSISFISAVKSKLKIRMLGYRDTTLIIAAFKSSIVNLADIKMDIESNVIDLVTVWGKRRLVELRGDRISLDIEGNIMAASSNVLEVLTRSPGVYVTSDDDIMLNSKSNVLITINGRQTYMTGKELANYLRSIPANSVKSIELISNPPANYDAAGTGGVIDIVLANNTIKGLHGSVTVGSTYNSKVGFTTSAILNYMTSKFQTKFDVSQNDVFYRIDLNIDRNFKGLSVIENELFSQNTRWDMRGKITQATGAINYSLNHHHKIGTSYQLYYLDKEDNRNGNTKIFNGNSIEPSNIVGTSVNEKSPQSRHVFDMFYSGKLDTIGSSLDANVSYIKANRDFRSTLISSGVDKLNAGSNIKVFTNNPIGYNILAGQVDYSKVLGKGLKISSGLKFSSVSSDNNLMVKKFEGEVWKEDIKSSNHFIYQEKIGAAYLSLDAPLSREIHINVGTRIENTWAHGKSRTTGEESNRSYFDFFPSISATKSFNDKHKITLNYNRRITDLTMSY